MGLGYSAAAGKDVADIDAQSKIGRPGQINQTGVAINSEGKIDSIPGSRENKKTPSGGEGSKEFSSFIWIAMADYERASPEIREIVWLYSNRYD